MNDDTHDWQDVLASVWDTLDGPALSAPEPAPAAEGAAYTPTQLLVLQAQARSSKGLLEGFGEEGFMGGWVPYGQAIQQLYRRLAGGDLAKEKRIEQAMQRIQDGTASADDHALIIDYSVEASRPGSVLYTAAQTLRSTVKFGGELAITSPIGGAASKLATAGKAAMPGAGAATRALGFAARTGAQFGATEAIGYGLEALATVGTNDEAWSPADYEAARRALPVKLFPDTAPRAIRRWR